MPKFSVSITDQDHAELQSQALALGKTRTAHAGDMLRDALSHGATTAKEVENLRVQLRVTERELRRLRRRGAEQGAATTLGQATGPPWSDGYLEGAEVREWWEALRWFVGHLGKYGVQVENGWWENRLLVEACAAAYVWWLELETSGGDATATARDKLDFLRWVNEDIRRLAEAHDSPVLETMKTTQGGSGSTFEEHVAARARPGT
ncbi:MAG: hypothetical protein ABR573_03940 [Candidatus Dormibacteria bacterium]